MDGITCVSKSEIAKSLILFEEKEGKLLEGSGASALAGLLKNKETWDLGKKVLVLVSGSNMDKASFQKIKNKYNS